MSTRTAQIEPASDEAWRTGANPRGDEALQHARKALFGGDSPACFTALKVAMVAYGWEFHSDVKARKLWDEWQDLFGEFPPFFWHPSRASNVCNRSVANLFHKVYRAVHCDRGKKHRRNPPPWNLTDN
jgi:hypothetical protein